VKLVKRHKYSVFANIVKKFHNKKVMVIGDLLLDQFIWGSVSRISPEAPVPVLLVNKQDSYMPGGGCNVANNLAELGAEVYLVGVVGEDYKGEKLRELLAKRKINIDGVLTDASRQTILKTRVMAHHHPYHQQIVRVDREDGHNISESLSKKIIKYVEKNICNVDAVIIEDYGKGLITSSLLKNVIKLAGDNGKIISVDPKENHFNIYKNVSVITPNRFEASKVVGFSLETEKKLKEAGKKLLKDTNSDVVLITLGEEGMMLFQKGKDSQKIPTVAQDVFDVSGAGDTVIGVYTLSRVSGANPRAAADIANCAAGIVVSRSGTAVVGKEELLENLKSYVKG
jgi:rfaE bifunctional protein kinase chain/domain